MCALYYHVIMYGVTCAVDPSRFNENCVGSFELVCRGQAIGCELDTLQGKLVPVCLPSLQLRGLVAEDEVS